MSRDRIRHYVGLAVGDAVRTIITLAVVLLIIYLAFSAFYGYRVGRIIYAAKAANPYIAIASNMVGREQTEHFAITRLQVPDFITKSPAFWLTLRLSE
jgi:hypothetical protein